MMMTRLWACMIYRVNQKYYKNFKISLIILQIAVCLLLPQQLLPQQALPQVQQQLQPSVHQPMRDWCAQACAVIRVPSSPGRAPDCKRKSPDGHQFRCYSQHCTKTWKKASLNTYILHVKRYHNVDLRDKTMTLQTRIQYLPRQ